jgi:hypothetical protein
MYMRTGIGGAAEFGVEIGERRGGFFDRLLVGAAVASVAAATRHPVPFRTPECPCR